MITRSRVRASSAAPGPNDRSRPGSVRPTSASHGASRAGVAVRRGKGSRSSTAAQPATPVDVHVFVLVAPPSHTGDMADQLTLITLADRSDWRLDDRTREVGLRGIEAARQALQAAARRT